MTLTIPRAKQRLLVLVRIGAGFAGILTMASHSVEESFGYTEVG